MQCTRLLHHLVQLQDIYVFVSEENGHCSPLMQAKPYGCSHSLTHCWPITNLLANMDVAANHVAALTRRQYYWTPRGMDVYIYNVLIAHAAFAAIMSDKSSPSTHGKAPRAIRHTRL